MVQGRGQGQLSCSPPIGGRPLCVVCEHPQQPLLQPPSTASPIAAAPKMLLGAASMPHVVASWHYYAESELPPNLLSPRRCLVRHPEKIEDFYEELPCHLHTGKPLVRH